MLETYWQKGRDGKRVQFYEVRVQVPGQKSERYEPYRDDLTRKEASELLRGLASAHNSESDESEEGPDESEEGQDESAWERLTGPRCAGCSNGSSQFGTSPTQSIMCRPEKLPAPVAYHYPPGLFAALSAAR
jgi:hypothetical protein